MNVALCTFVHSATFVPCPGHWHKQRAMPTRRKRHPGPRSTAPLGPDHRRPSGPAPAPRTPTR